MAIDAIGRFTVLGTLGTGAHSTIFRVRREADGREYALKQVSVDSPAHHKFLEQVRHEHRVGRMLDHPHLVKVHALEEEKGLFGLGAVKKARLLVEYIGGAQPLDAIKVLKPAKLLRIFEKVAGGLAHMHAKGVLHADLKPGNIVVGRGANAKVIDYGLAWIKGEAKDRVQGTPEYMAPETATHKLVNERTDVFNLGATMYRLATFQLPPSVMPVEGVKMREKQYLNMLTPVGELAPKTPPGFAALIHKCLQFDANKRPADMAEVHAALDGLADAAEAAMPPDEIDW